MQYHYTQQEIQLAHEIASALKDRDSIGMHLKFARIYKEERLREALAKAMKVDPTTITSSRAAIYVSIVKRGDSYGSVGS